MNSPPLVPVALLSAATLGYEILLMRMFSIIQWHHFAYMMISVAMLGYGAAGTFVAVFQRPLLARFSRVFVGAAALFGITAVAGFLLAQRVGFNPLEIFWDPQQSLRLLAIYGLLCVPFFCAATCICLTFTRFAGEPHRIYGFDIVGAGVGCLAILATLFLATPAAALRLVGALGLTAAAVAAAADAPRPRALAAVLLVFAFVVAAVLPQDWTRLQPSPYKELSQALRVVGSRIVAERSSPLAMITVVENRAIPLRHAPGMSLNATIEPPPQLGIFTDGDGPNALARYDGRRGPLAYLDFLTSALPYHLLDRPRVLVLGAGAGSEVLQAIDHDARAIDAVELNPLVIDLVQHQFADFSGRPFSASNVRVHIAEARAFVAQGRNRYDLIQVALLDAFGASSAGLHALAESYLYTVEAFDAYLDLLEPGGLLAITRWVDLPPRDVLKLFATATAALEGRGITQPGEQLALIRGWKTATLVVKNGVLTGADLAMLTAFCRARSFDVDYYPGIRATDTNRYNVLDQPYFYSGALAVLGPERAAFFDRYKFDIAPATDDRPFFFQFLKWRTLPELLRLKDQGGLPLLEWGYPVLIATLLQALCASVALILLPLWIARRRTRKAHASPPSAPRIAAYFAAIGFAFMFIEMAFLQKFLLFLGHPLYAIAVVLSAFLIFAGLGSRYAGRRRAGDADRAERAPVRPVAAIGLIALGYLVLLPGLFRTWMPISDALKIPLTIGLIAPLAFAMGIPFPLGLANLARGSPTLLPWAWAVNACASVVAAVLATLLAIHLGFNAVILLAVLLYALAAVAHRSLRG